MKISIKSSLIFSILMLLFISSLDAQKSRTRTRTRGETTEEKVSLMEKINIDIKFGNIGFGSAFSLSLKPSVGYKFSKPFSAGLGSRMQYTFVTVQGANDVSIFDYGFFGYGRAKLSESFYLQGEYTTYSIDNGLTRDNLTYPLVGGGYVSGLGDWKFGLEVMFVLSENAREKYGSLIEWWFSASYNF